MAEKTVVLRPSADIQLQHVLYPSELTAGYLAIGEEAYDGMSTYIPSSNLDSKSIFILSESDTVKVKSVAKGNICLYFSESDTMSNNLDGKVYVELYVNEKFVSEYFSTIHDPGSIVFNISDNDIQIINNYVLSYEKIPEIWLSLRFKVEVRSNDSGKGGGGDVGLSQMYFNLDCLEDANNGIFDKINGTYKASSKVYKKLGNLWSEISEEEAKTILKNNNIRRG